MRKEKYYQEVEWSFLVTVHADVDEHKDAPEQDGIKNILEDAIQAVLKKEEKGMDGVEFGVAAVRVIEPA